MTSVHLLNHSQCNRIAVTQVAAAFSVVLLFALYLSHFAAWAAGGEHFFSGSILVGSLVLCGGLMVAVTFPRLRHYAFRWRYGIAVSVVALAVVFQASGSSLGCWAGLTGEPNEGLLFGMARGIRADEWKVLTGFFASQATEGFPLVNDVIRAAPTVTSIVYALPSFSLATLFHPFLVGFLVLPFGSGLAFFWVGRLVALFMVTFEFLRLVTNDRRGLSVAGAAVLTFTPLVQWWFAVNGIAEILIFGMLLVMLLDSFLRSETLGRRWTCALLMGYCAACYLLTFYPAWQVPLFCVFAAMGVWVFLGRKKARAPRGAAGPALRVWVLPLAVSVVVFGALLGVVLVQGWPAVAATLSTVYPGSRTLTGGSAAYSLFTGSAGCLLPFGYAPMMNQCELAGFFTFFPLGACLGLYAAIKKRDPLCVCLLVVYAVLIWYLVFGLPEWLATLTLLGKSSTNRVPLATGVIEVVLIARVLASAASWGSEERHQVRILAIGAVTISVFGSLGIFQAFGAMSALEELGIVVPAACALLGIVTVLAFDGGCGGRATWALGAACVLALCAGGICVNPVQQGTQPLTGSSAYQTIQDIAKADDDAIWVASDSATGQLCAAAGAAAINTVNVYPDVSRWELIDPTRQYEEVWNRYAHIKVNIVADAESSFELLNPDVFQLNLSVDDISTLGIRYIVTTRDLSQVSLPSGNLSPVCSLGGSLGTVWEVVD